MAPIVAAAWWVEATAQAPLPDIDRVDHAHPVAALELLTTMGSRERIEAIAREIHGETFEERLIAIDRWIREHLTLDPSAAYAWRDVDTMVDDGTYGGCADHALLFGAFARAVGIPVVWVKTMDVDWILEFRSGPREPSTWRGHVFLELYDGQRWVLLDATRLRIYDDYDPDARLLPGYRFACDKGLDPYELVLSTRWELWKEQTRATFASLDLAVLPVDGGRALGTLVFIAGDNPGFDLAAGLIRSSGLDVGPSGNAGFAEWMPSVPGQTLLVLSLSGRDVLLEPYLTRYAGSSFADLAARHDRRWWTGEHQAPDGTTVVLV